MKKIILTLAAVIASFSIYAQVNTAEYEILKDLASAEHKALVAENLTLTEEQQKIFWPLYNDYRAAMNAHFDKEVELLKKFADNYENMSDETASSITNTYFSLLSEENKIRSTHTKKMLKVLPPKLVFRFTQIENKLAAVAQFDAAMEIPLIVND